MQIAKEEIGGIHSIMTFHLLGECELTSSKKHKSHFKKDQFKGEELYTEE
jgi:hypothetical protein